MPLAEAREVDPEVAWYPSVGPGCEGNSSDDGEYVSLLHTDLSISFI